MSDEDNGTKALSLEERTKRFAIILQALAGLDIQAQSRILFAVKAFLGIDTFEASLKKNRALDEREQGS